MIEKSMSLEKFKEVQKLLYGAILLSLEIQKMCMHTYIKWTLGISFTHEELLEQSYFPFLSLEGMLIFDSPLIFDQSRTEFFLLFL